ncbi:MAG: histidine phosphatase family protein [Acidimicrobiales bacterium]
MWLVRHAETEWSRSGQHTGSTDLPLTHVGEEKARALGAALAALAGRAFDLVACSPRRRATRTAELAGLEPYEVWEDLAEWDYGELEGRTTAAIRESLPGWSIWEGPWRGGETAADVGARADRVIARVLAGGQGKGAGDSRRVVLVGHGHFSRVLGARWVGAGVGAGRWLDLDTASISELGCTPNGRVLRRWNVPGVPPGYVAGSAWMA